MSDWSWKQAVAERVIQITNETGSAVVSIDDLYRHLEEFSKLFPRNRHVREKIRQILQRLRDDGFLSFQGGGRYLLNLGYEELESEPAPLGARGIEAPGTKEVVRNVRLRSTLLGVEIKRRYRYTCQVCRVPVPLWRNRYYAEAHHLWPLGSPHFGPDVPGNIIVLCPNHHVMFDRGVATILPDSLRLQHLVEGVFARRAQLYVEPWHSLRPKCIQLHHREIFQKGLLLTRVT
jgi:predicted restriction endonuclease